MHFDYQVKYVLFFNIQNILTLFVSLILLLYNYGINWFKAATFLCLKTGPGFLAHSVVVIVVFNDLRSDVVVLFVDIDGIAGNNYLVLFYNMLIVAECYSTIVFNNKIIIRITLLLTLHR